MDMFLSLQPWLIIIKMERTRRPWIMVGIVWDLRPFNTLTREMINKTGGRKSAGSSINIPKPGTQGPPGDS
jgi:hypothetical protein